MKQPIAGVVPFDVAEASSMTVWPSIGATPAGRLVGRLAALEAGPGIFTLGNVLAVLTIPISLGVYVWHRLPFLATRYTLTNRRIVIQKGLQPADAASIGLDEFDSIDIEALEGQKWLRAGDLVFRRDAEEVFRLPGVPRPEPFREVCLKARMALVTVREVLRSQAATGA